MPLVFNSQDGNSIRSLTEIPIGKIQDLRTGMTALQDILKNLEVPDGFEYINNISLSGSFPAEEIAMILAQNKECTHISFLTGHTYDDGDFTLLVPMKDVMPGDPTSGTIIEKSNTYYSAICCQHPPLT